MLPPSLVRRSFVRLLALGLLAAPALLHSQTADAPRTIIVFGDSITAGNALPPQDQPRAWIHLIEEESKGRLKLVNEGKGGRPSASRPEFDAMLVKHPKPDGLVIALGMNDSRDITEKCVPLAVGHLKYMIEQARKTYGAELPVLLVGPSNINKAALGPTKPIANEREGKLKEMNAAFQKLAGETHCDFVSLFGVVPETSLTKDGVHPDVAGNAAIADVLKAKLLK